MPEVFVDIINLPRSKRIGARIPYLDGKGPIVAKTIDGARWNPDYKVWTYPLDLQTCYRLREVFGKSLTIGTALANWAREAKGNEAKIAEVATMSLDVTQPLPNVERTAPTIHAAMMARGYQTIAPYFGTLTGNFLLADEPGLGKTLETFGTLIERGVAGKILVIAPATSLEATWAAEIAKWLGADLDVASFLASRSGMGVAARTAQIRAALECAAQYVFVLINPEMVRLKEEHRCEQDDGRCDSREFCRNPKQHKVTRVTKYPELFEFDWDAIVCDETHRYLINANPRARKPSQVGLGLQRLQVRPDGVKVALSGTPMKGRPRLLWPTLHWLRPDLYSSQWRWSRHYFKTEADRYASTGEKITDDLRPEREEAFNRELGRIMLRRTKKELQRINPAWAPPDKQYIDVWLPMGDKQSREYKAMEDNAAASISGGLLMADGILAEMTRLRQFASASGALVDGTFHPRLPSNKFDWLVEFLADRGITGKAETDWGTGKYVIASQFTKLINLFAEGLCERGIAVHVLTGETSGKERAAMQRDWQENVSESATRVMLLNTTAGGVSITLDRADDCVILDETWVPDDQEQVEDRIHRTSRTDHQVTIWYVRSEGTIERHLMDANDTKDIRQKRSLDGRRGVEFAKARWGKKED